MKTKAVVQAERTAVFDPDARMDDENTPTAGFQPKLVRAVARCSNRIPKRRVKCPFNKFDVVESLGVAFQPYCSLPPVFTLVLFRLQDLKLF